jgi:uncharacterized protein
MAPEKDMLFDVSRLRGDAERIDREFAPGSFDCRDEEFRVVQPVHLTAEIRKDTQKVRVVGRVQTTLEDDCSRCLEAFSIPVDSKFDLLFLPASDNVGGEAGARDDEQEVQEDDLGVSYYKGDVIDLGDVMREQFYLALPMKPLCQENCRGLCPVCGVNRNRETCSCQTEWVDPRMDALRKLKHNA